MSYQALYRVWRPQRFEDIVGQEHVTQTLKNALKEGHLSHAYLFNGPRGTGKTSAAKILAKAVNCVDGLSPEPCNQCIACQRITEGSLLDVVEIDAASNRGVDEIRDLRDKVKYAPTEVRYKVYIIDEVHMLTTEAFNALLKTLEEPPRHVLFILATTEPHKLPATILSRCQRFTFRRISFEKIVHHLKKICEVKQVSYTEQALFAITNAADGGMRDALSLLDQALALGGNTIEEETILSITGSVSKQTIFTLLQAIVQRKAAEALNYLDDLITQGVEAERIMQDLTYACRDLLLIKSAPQLEKNQGLIELTESNHELIEQCTIQQLTEMLDIFIHYQQQMKFVAHHRILLEVVIVRLCQLSVTADYRENPQMKQLEEEIAKLKLTITDLKKSLEQKRSPASNTSEVGKSKVSALVSPSPAPSMIQSDWLKQASEDQLLRVKKAWGDILQLVKKERVTVHAWLIDGEPVAASDQVILVAFQTKIHRNTIEKSEMKSMVEKMIAQVLGSSYRLQTMMVDEWKQIQKEVEPKAKLPSSSSEDVYKKTDHVKAEDDIVKRAVKLFGEELVEIYE
ncbi:DNA polymerase III subunit gamma/tau [Thermoflavimicrobium daqui]|uniref:DNA polymerase III subunit gamma/tau n=1 Tax=Thermoflavimicrobium daqui TaxID=2137476 RepID=UPI00143D33D6|nr:DNA polymerase III subunit gamma/tau [Thermoflavimicrobium daqui]